MTMDLHPHLLSLPSPDGLQRMAEALGGGFVTDVVRLAGGLDCATHAFSLEGRRLVVKRSRPGEVRERKRARVEFENLELARRCAVATPEPLALDEDGAWFGTEALVMTALDGELDLHPHDLAVWTRELALALLAIQDRPTDGVPQRRKPELERWSRPDGEDSRLDALGDVVERLRRIDHGPAVFTHTDFHPGNVLFRGGRVVGVIDWMYVAVEPRQLGVAKARGDLAVYPGGDAPDLFLAAYEEEWGRPLEHLALWDALEAIGPYLWGFTWEPSFRDVGIELAGEAITAAGARFIDAALERSGISG